ncbi:MAG TPA: ABC transporter permease subunit [Gemmatimonadaceae bacterium]
MSATTKVIKYEMSNVVRSRWVLAYALFFFLVTDALLRFGGDGTRALLSLVNIVLFIIPLVTIVFGTMYLYDAREFTELLLAQPVHRRQLFAGLYVGLALPLSLGFLAGVGLPFALHGLGGATEGATLAALALAGVLLTSVFTAIAFLIAVRSEDKVKGLGLAIAIWLAFAVVYDGLVLLAVSIFADYPLERPMVAMMLANPVDLARVFLLMRFDVAALMGYTGAVFERLFGTERGVILALGVLGAWCAVPLALGLRWFQRKDF